MKSVFLYSKGKLGDALLSHDINHTIIGEETFHCPVRDGKEWVHFSIVTKQFLLPLFTAYLS